MNIPSHDDGRDAIPPGLCGAWFADRPAEVRRLPRSGFSGATVYVVQPAGSVERFVLKAFGQGTPLERAVWIHRLMRHAAAAGVAEVPELRPSCGGRSVVTAADGRHWEMVRFVPGSPTEEPTPAQAVAAAAVLARFHRAAATMSGSASTRGPAAAVTRRVAQARQLRERPWLLRRRGLPRGGSADRSRADGIEAALERWDRAIAMFAAGGGQAVVEAVARVCPAVTCLQPVIRDIWSDHVLFDDGLPARVAGIVDFHAAAIDTPATDLSRLLGSWRASATPTAPALLDRWPDALAAYETIRPLEADDRQRVAFLHAAAVLCGLDHWFRWIVEERRDFAAWEAVLGRIDWHLEQLPAALEWLARRAPGPV